VIIKNVLFEFRKPANAEATIWTLIEGEVGEVQINEDRTQMALDIPCPDDLPYMIRGRRLPDGHFSGRHVGQPDDEGVLASWREVEDGHWEGQWRETNVDPGEEVLQFTFRLP
jgi:hypothetical protein